MLKITHKTNLDEKDLLAITYCIWCKALTPYYHNNYYYYYKL
jgi:hypothetical protein